MRGKIPMLLMVLAGAALALGAGASGARLGYEKALALEEANGRLEEAIALFRKVVADAKGDNALAAQAQLHIGICYEKLARKEARAAYQTVLEKYPAQQEAVRAARERLGRLMAALRPARSTTVREFGRSVPLAPGKLGDPAGDAPFFAVSSDGETFVYTDWMTGDLLTRSPASGKVKPLYGVDWSRSTEFFMAPVISRDQKRIAYTSQFFGGSADLNRVGVDALWGGSRETVYESGESFAMPLDWSPDGTKILSALFSLDGSVALVAIDTRIRRVERLVTLNWDNPQRAEYSPDGRWIAYDSTKDGERKIYLMASDGSQERVVVDSPGEDDSPVWSPDGRFLIFRSNRSGDWDLVGVPIEKGKAGEPFLIKTNIGEATLLRGITADGRLFYGEQVAGPSVYLMERTAAGLGAPRIVPAIQTRSNSQPAFSPDGKRLVYVAGRTFDMIFGRPLVRITTLEGKLLKEFSFGLEFRNLRRPLFSPDGSKIALIADDRKRQRVVLVVSADTGARLKTFKFDSGAYLLMSGWSDDRHLCVLANKPGGREARLERIDVETDERTSTAMGRNDGLSTKVSPDGKYLVIRKFPPPAPDKIAAGSIIVRSLADGGEKEVMHVQVGSDIAWDFDSRHLLYRKGIDPKQLFRCSIETGVEEVLWDGAQDHHIAAASPDGRLLAFEKRGLEWRIWVVENFLPGKPAAAPGALRSSR